jgi:hypothetical protein
MNPVEKSGHSTGCRFVATEGGARRSGGYVLD